MRAGLLALVFVVTFGGTLFANMPARVVVSQERLAAAGLSASDVRGTVWRAEISGLATPQQSLGDLHLTIAPGAVLLGRLEGQVRLEGALGRANARVERGVFGGPTRLYDVSAQLAAAHISALDPVLRARGGGLSVAARSVTVSDGGDCVSAEGRFAMDVLTRRSGPRDWVGPEILGDVACDTGAFQAVFAGEDGVTAISGRARLDVRAGQAGARVEVRSSDQAVQFVLPVLDFIAEGDVYVFDRQVAADAWLAF